MEVMDKGKIYNLMKDVITNDKRILFAYVYGSFPNAETFRDIDIAIYVENYKENPYLISSDLKTELSRSIRKENMNFTADQFDIQIINEAPFTFLKRIFKEGILLIDRDPELRTDLIEYVSLKYRECAGLLAEASLV